jgi:hypothetical protein
MKKLFVLVVLFAFAAGSVCFAAETTKAKDPVTATAQVAGETVKAVGDVAVAPVKAITGSKTKAKTKKEAAK